MNLPHVLLATGASLLFLALVFVPLEKVLPAKPGQKVFRRHWGLDLSFFLGQYLLWGGLVLSVMHYLHGWVDGLVPATVRMAIGQQPFWLQALEVLVLSDLLIYWGHRLQHRVDFLWRFHQVHHSAEHLDWLAAHREHPIDTIYTVGLINLPAFVTGFDLDAIATLVAFRGIWAIYIHSNVRLPLGPVRMLIGAPELHHWHHDRARDRGNYANISPLMDLIFGTYVCPPTEPDEFGLSEDFPQTYLGQMLAPLLPKQWWDWLKRKPLTWGQLPKTASPTKAPAKE
jgi:sterol desaturase/sphingolipid hydroxylase (fatty acid hydroxylase superfamily)